MSKLAILADPLSLHTYKWINHLSKCAYTILIVGISEKTTDIYSTIENVTCKMQSVSGSNPR